MKLLCDQMLNRLGRWLRAAGYDTEIIYHSVPDRKIFEFAQQEQRLVLTRDHHFLEMDPHQHLVVWLRTNELRASAQEITLRLKIDWLTAPFSRCLLCNQILIQADSEILNQVPKDVLARSQQFWFCPHCSKVYWEGSHTKRMLEKLQAWQQGNFL